MIFTLGTSRARRMLLLASAVCISALASADAGAATIKWKLTAFVPENNGIFVDYVKVFAANVAKETNGEVEIQPFGVGVLASTVDGPKAVQQGVADLGFFFSAFLVNDDPANTVLSGLPGGMPSDALMHWLYKDGGEKLWQDFRRDKMGLHSLVAGLCPTEVFLHSHKPVRTAEDMKGFRIRTVGAWADVAQSFGASPITTPPAEIFTALERRVIDGVEFASPGLNVNLGYQNIAKYIILPGIHVPSCAFEVFWKADKWDALPEKVKEQITTAARTTAFEGFMRVGMGDLAAMEKFQAGKNEIIRLDPTFIAEVRKRSRQWADNKAAEQDAKGNPWMKKLRDSYYGFYDRWTKNAAFRITD
jgi:TRAP-type mannitol/chloroaromatic compound transport system substrate-binding protein